MQRQAASENSIVAITERENTTMYRKPAEDTVLGKPASEKVE